MIRYIILNDAPEWTTYKLEHLVVIDGESRVIQKIAHYEKTFYVYLSGHRCLDIPEHSVLLSCIITCD